MRARGGIAIFISSVTYLSNTSANATWFGPVDAHKECPPLSPAFQFLLVGFLCTGRSEVRLLLNARWSWLISTQVFLNKRLVLLHQSMSNLWTGKETAQPWGFSPKAAAEPGGQHRGAFLEAVYILHSKRRTRRTDKNPPHHVTRKADEELPCPLQSHMRNEYLGNIGTV